MRQMASAEYMSESAEHWVSSYLERIEVQRQGADLRLIRLQSIRVNPWQRYAKL